MNLTTRFGTLASAVALIGAGLALPAGATETTPAPVCGSWLLRGAAGAYPAVVFGESPAGAAVLDASTVKLVKPAAGIDPGVEFAVKDLDVKADAITTVSVHFETADGASTAAGAVRLFGYATKDANTLLDAPTYASPATGTNGALSFDLPAGAKLGTLGLVYDASNSAGGSVTFSDLTIGKRPVSLLKCASPSASASASTSASPSASTSTSASASASASTSASASASASTSASASAAVTVPTTEPTTIPTTLPVPAGSGSALPVTGPSLGLFVAGGAALVGIGTAALVITWRRRRQSFVA